MFFFFTLKGGERKPDPELSTVCLELTCNKNARRPKGSGPCVSSFSIEWSNASCSRPTRSDRLLRCDSGVSRSRSCPGVQGYSLRSLLGAPSVAALPSAVSRSRPLRHLGTAHPLSSPPVRQIRRGSEVRPPGIPERTAIWPSSSAASI